MNNVQRTQNLESLPKTQLVLSYGIAGVLLALIVIVTASSPETLNWGRALYLLSGFCWAAVAIAGLWQALFSLEFFIKYYALLRNSSRVWGFVALLLAVMNIVGVAFLWIPLYFFV